MKNKKFDLKKLPMKFGEIIFLGINPDIYEKIKKSGNYENAKTTVQEERLGTFLKLSVPLWYNEIKERSLDEVMKRKDELATIIGSMGDVLLFPDPENPKGRVEEVFNAFSESTAILAALAHGGVEIFGAKFDFPLPEKW